MKNLNPRFVIYVFILIVLLPASVNRMQGSVGASKAGRSRNLVAPIEAENVLKMMECTFFFIRATGLNVYSRLESLALKLKNSMTIFKLLS